MSIDVPDVVPIVKSIVIEKVVVINDIAA